MEMQNSPYHLLIAALTNFKRNKIRTVLTSLGIMIGVLSVVMLIALGLGLKNYIQNQFEGLGSNLVAVMPGNSFSEEGGLQGMTAGFIGGVEFDDKDIANLEKVKELQYIVPVFYKTSIAYFEKEEEFCYIFGTTEEVFNLLNLEKLKGVFFTKSDIKRKSKRVVLGYEVAKKLFSEPELGVGEEIEILDLSFKVIGVNKKKGDPEMDTSVYMPYTTTFGRLNPSETFFSIYLGVENEEDVDRAKEKVEEILLERYDEDEFSVVEQTEMLETVNQIFSMINAVLIAIGSISLLVGGIGIMNIMYATVTERTKEVGIRRAIGATRGDILYQFLTESVVLSLFGGVLGLLVSTLIVILVRPYFPLAINPLAVGVALVVSSGIGIFFGVFPAKRAANLPPIEAIRYE